MKSRGLRIIFTITAAFGLLSPWSTSSGTEPAHPFFYSKPDVRDERRHPSVFWVCADLRTASIEIACDYKGPDEYTEPSSVLQISLRIDDTMHDFGLRHAIEPSDCKKQESEIQDLLKRDNRFCILGSVTNHSDTPEGGYNSWVYFEFRTPSGRSCDFCP